MDGPSSKSGDETMAIRHTLYRQLPGVILITMGATKEDGFFEGIGEVFSRVDFARCVGQHFEFHSKCHVLQDSGLTSSLVIGGVERHLVVFEYGVSACGVAGTLLRSRDTASCTNSHRRGRTLSESRDNGRDKAIDGTTKSDSSGSKRTKGHKTRREFRQRCSWIQ